MSLVKEHEVTTTQTLWVELADVDSELVAGGSSYYGYYGYYGYEKKNSKNDIFQVYSFSLIGDNNYYNGNRYY